MQTFNRFVGRKLKRGRPWTEADLVRTVVVMIVAALFATASASAGAARSAERSAGSVPSSAGAAAPAVAKDEPRAERRCRSLADRRLARLRKAAVARGRSRIGIAARRRVGRKLRRCLAAGRRRAQGPDDIPSPSPTPGGPLAPGAPTPPLSSFVGVTASDSEGFRLTLTRPVVAAGTVTIELRNTDSGPHDLVVRPEAGGAEAARFDPADPGAVTRKQATLAAGDWYLYCSLEGHEFAGMHATLKAR